MSTAIADSIRTATVTPLRPAIVQGGAALAAPRERELVPTGKIHLTRRGRVVFSILAIVPLVLVAVILGLGASGAVATDTAVNAEFSYVTVDAGDTLWNIALELAPNEDPRDVIAEIRSLNGLETSAVQAGEELAVPLRLS